MPSCARSASTAQPPDRCSSTAPNGFAPGLGYARNRTLRKPSDDRRRRTQTERLTRNSEQVPLAGDALEIVHAALFELDARSGNEVLDGPRDEYLAWVCLGGDSRARVHGDPGDLAVDKLALPRVEPGTYVEP